MTATSHRVLMISGSAAALAIACQPALAQVAEDAPDAPAAVQPEDEGALREIIVTAQKRSESIQTVPMAVTALDAKALGQGTVKDLRDISGRIPSLVVDSVPSSPSMASIALRGISFDDVEKSFDPAVGVAVDGVFIGTNTGQLLDSFDMERLEVLRGPQGTLFGRNTIGGVISVTRTRPTVDAGIKAEFAYSSFNTLRGRAVVNTGKLGDLIAFKAFGSWDKTDGFVRNVVQNRNDGRYETLSGGITALITPSPDFSATVTYQHTRERGEAMTLPISNGTDVFCAFAGFPGFSQPAECGRFEASSDRGAYVTYETAPRAIRNDSDSVTANIEWDISPTLKLSSVTGYQRNSEDAGADFDGTEVDFFASRRVQNYRQFSQELRLLADLSDRVNVLVGGYYFDSSYALNSYTFVGPALGGVTIEQFTRHSAKSYAAFADAQIKLSDSLKLSLGGRYTHDEKSIFTNYGQVASLVQLTVPTFTGVECVEPVGVFTPLPGLTLPIYAGANNCSGQVSFGKFTWHANLQYTIEPGKMVYASYARGFRSGGFNSRATFPTSLGPYQPETVDSFELGLKADWLDRKLRTNIALYYARYRNKQEEVVQPSTSPFAANPQETIVKNAATATIKGIEVEAIAQLSPELSATASFAYTDAKYDTFLNDVVGLTNGSGPDGIPDDISALQLRRAPKFQWTFGLNYTREVAHGRLDAGVLLRYSSSYATCISPARPIVRGAVTNDPRCVTKDRENLSAQFGYTHFLGNDRELSLSVFGRNLTDVRDIMGALPVAGLFTFATPLEPRVVGVQVGFKY
jgi:iron complex outermembrane recepter protein